MMISSYMSTTVHVFSKDNGHKFSLVFACCAWCMDTPQFEMLSFVISLMFLGSVEIVLASRICCSADRSSCLLCLKRGR